MLLQAKEESARLLLQAMEGSGSPVILVADKKIFQDACEAVSIKQLQKDAQQPAFVMTVGDSKHLIKHCCREDGPLCSAMLVHKMDLSGVLQWRKLLLESTQGDAARACVLDGAQPGLKAVSVLFDGGARVKK